jgi:hypothetical protein
MSSEPMPLSEQLESLTGYFDWLDNKYPPHWTTNKLKIKMADKEMKRVSKRIRELTYCKRHTGIHGLDCFMCKMEGMF